MLGQSSLPLVPSDKIQNSPQISIYFVLGDFLAHQHNTGYKAPNVHKQVYVIHVIKNYAKNNRHTETQICVNVNS